MTTPVSALPADYSASTLASTSRTGTQELGKDDFLKLLVTSLQYQDPSEPMSTSELMSQTTQLSSMEQLSELTQTSSRAFAMQVQQIALSLVGTTVKYLDAQGAVATGRVDSVDFTGTSPALVVNGTRVGLGNIATVAPTDAPSSSSASADASSTAS